jgi:uncharacterized protein (TIRG00374 family)
MTDEDRGNDSGRRRTAKLIVGFGVAVVLVYLLGTVIGWEETIKRLRSAHLGWVAAACASSLLCLAVWSKMWQVVLEAVGISVKYRKVVVTFFAASFANYVTPMGQAGGEPLVAYVLSRDPEASYEQSLASVVITDVLRLLPFFTVAGLGLGYLFLERQLPAVVETVAVVLAVLAIGLPTLMVVGWRHRLPVQKAFLRLLSPVALRTERFSIEGVRRRIDSLYDSVELVADSRRALIVSVGLAYVGWVLFALPLYFSGLALDLPVSLLLVFFIVPATIVVSFTPLPGGLGAIEGALVLLLTALATFSAGEALAITTVYRLASYWLVVGVGGLAALWVTARI